MSLTPASAVDEDVPERAAGHIHVVADRVADRRRAMPHFGAAELTVSCHRQLRGPYTGLGPVLTALVPEAYRRWPGLVEAHRLELTYTVPDLVPIIGPAPQTLVSTTPHEERTRYFASPLIRAMSQGVVTFLIALARSRAVASPETGPLILAFDQAQAADQTEQEFLALLVRRADPSQLRVLIGTPGEIGGGAQLAPELAAALADFATLWNAPAQAAKVDEARPDAELLAAYLASDGTSDDPAELAAYLATDGERRAQLHDVRAEELAQLPGLGARLGALPYHAERGTDPTGRGRAALRNALEHCVAVGFSEATIDFGMRGRAVCDPVADQQDYCHFSAKAAAALIPLNREPEAETIYIELRRRYPLPRVQMTTSYGLAMLHTRFFADRDHDLALAHQNNAVAFAALETDPEQAAYLQVFHDNALALIEVHRRNPQRALELVSRGLERLDRELGPDRYRVHRSQLLHNRSRVLGAIGRPVECEADLTTLIELDPNYLEYHTDRGNLRRRQGDLPGALADYDRAVAVGPPLPELYYNRGNLRAEAGDVAGAIADHGYALEMAPSHLDARVNHATLLLEADELEAALADVRAGLKVHSAQPRLLHTLGLIEQARGEIDAARRAFDLALRVDPGFAPALAGRALLRYDCGDVDGALGDLDDAIALAGDDPDLLYNRGVAYLEAARPGEAARDFDLALGLPGADRAELLAQRARCLPEPVGGQSVASS
jgi:tetratricopeptide (TPR) repeat protein